MTPAKMKKLAMRLGTHVIPDLGQRLEDAKYAAAHVKPLPPLAAGDRYAAGSRLATPGLVLDPERQLNWLARIGEFRELFSLIRTNVLINPQYHVTGDRIRNGYFPTPDAETYFAMIGLRKPSRIYEIGGGFSTLIARAAIDQFGLEAELVVIDPEPRTDVRESASRLILRRVEESGLCEETFDGTEIIFIDSSHIIQTRGDVPFLYCELVPSLAPGTLVHVHDIYLPFDYSALGEELWWTEQYILLAMLAANNRYTVELSLRWLTAAFQPQMAAIFGSSVAEPAHGGGSFWFSVEP